MGKQISLRKPNVLAVDDTSANLVALEAVLGTDYNLVFAYSGDEAISILKSRQDIDVILMDLQMPGKDGFQTAAEIKKIEAYHEIPIIFITAIYKEEPFVRKGYEVGGIDYFSKPFDPEILRMKISIYASFRQKAELLKERERHIRETEELLKAGKKLSSVLESLPVGVLISDMDGRICQTNGEMGRICKILDPGDTRSYGDLLGWWNTDGQIIKDSHGPLARALRSGTTSHNELIPIRCLNGAVKKVLCSASPLHALDGSIIGAVVVMQDVTESKKIEEDLEERITEFVSLGIELEQSARH